MPRPFIEKVFRVYIMASGPRGVLYVGMTGDLGGRATEHREGLIDGFTKNTRWIASSGTSVTTSLKPPIGVRRL